MTIGRLNQMAIHNVVQKSQPEPLSDKKELEDSNRFKNIPESASSKIGNQRANLTTPLINIEKRSETAPIRSEQNPQSLASRAKAMLLGNERKLAASILGVGALTAAGLAAYSLGPSIIQNLWETESPSQEYGGEYETEPPSQEYGSEYDYVQDLSAFNQSLNTQDLHRDVDVLSNSRDFGVNATTGIEKGSWITDLALGTLILTPLALAVYGVVRACKARSQGRGSLRVERVGSTVKKDEGKTSDASKATDTDASNKAAENKGGGDKKNETPTSQTASSSPTESSAGSTAKIEDSTDETKKPGVPGVSATPDTTGPTTQVHEPKDDKRTIPESTKPPEEKEKPDQLHSAPSSLTHKQRDEEDASDPLSELSTSINTKNEPEGKSEAEQESRDPSETGDTTNDRDTTHGSKAEDDENEGGKRNEEAHPSQTSSFKSSVSSSCTGTTSHSEEVHEESEERVKPDTSAESQTAGVAVEAPSDSKQNITLESEHARSNDLLKTPTTRRKKNQPPSSAPPALISKLSQMTDPKTVVNALKQKRTPFSSTLQIFQECPKTPLDSQTPEQQATGKGCALWLREIVAHMTHKAIEEDREPTATVLKKAKESHKKTQPESLVTMTPVLTEEINALLNSFLTQNKTGSSRLLPWLYQDMDQIALAQRLQLGKRSSSNSFEECSNKQWKDHLSFEEELMAAFICTSKTGPLGGSKAESTRFKDEQLTYDFNSVVFKELTNLRNPFCIIKKENNGESLKGANWLTFLGMDKWQELSGSINRSHYIPLDQTTGIYFDTQVYKKMMLLMLEPFIRDANGQAEALKTAAHLSLTPLGLPGRTPYTGGILVSQRMIELQIACYFEILQKNNFKFISDLNFSEFPSYVNKDFLLKLSKESNFTKELRLVPKTGESFSTKFGRRNSTGGTPQEAEQAKLFVLQTLGDVRERPAGEEKEQKEMDVADGKQQLLLSEDATDTQATLDEAPEHLLIN